MNPPTKGRATPEQNRGARDLARAIVDVNRSAKARVKAVEEATSLAATRPTVMKALLRTVGDSGAPVTVRRAALTSLQANSFRSSLFAAFQADYLEALRSIATDGDEALRTSALEILAAHGDEYGQRLLVEGLRDPATALVDPATALAMVGSDVHAQDFPLVRDLASSDDEVVRRSALRVLAADSDSVPMFRKIARDKDEDREARATSAIALQSLAPGTFKKLVEDVALDDDDFPEIRTTVLNALAHDQNVRPSKRVREQLDQLESAPEQVQQAAQRFLDRDADQ